MAARRVWMVTGTSSGLGAELARAALHAGDVVVATGRRQESVAEALRGEVLRSAASPASGAAGEEVAGDSLSDRLLVATLDVTKSSDATEVVGAAIKRFGRVDILVNNAGASFKGYFEEMTTEQVDRQLAANLLGPMNVTRAVLPAMRQQRSGHVISISSGAGLLAFEYSSAYAASKFGLEGWMGALAQEVAPFGIHTTIVNPGWFRTDLIRSSPEFWPVQAVEDYAERSTARRGWWEAQDGRQSGDPAKLARAVVALTREQPPPRRLIAGADALVIAEQKIAELKADIDDSRRRSASLAFDFDISAEPAPLE